MYAEQGEELNLTCTTDGGPDNAFVWTIDGQMIEESEVITIISTSNSSVLSINRVDASSHKGTYTCNVSNAYGTGQDTLTLTGIYIHNYNYIASFSFK